MGRRRSSPGVQYVGGLKEETTAFAGVGLLVELYRQAGVGATAEKVLPRKQSTKGLRQGQMSEVPRKWGVESLVLLSALGGKCLEDLERLRQDAGLAALLGYSPPAPETARQWLERFHEEKLLEGRPEQGAFLPPESAGLAGLRAVNRRVVAAYAESSAFIGAESSAFIGAESSAFIGVAAAPPKRTVTLDVDAHLVETSKAEAKVCYEGYKEYQPIEVTWAETGLVLAEEFREGPPQADARLQRHLAPGG